MAQKTLLKKIGVAAAVLFVLAILVSGASAIGFINLSGSSSSTSTAATPKYVYECSGRVNVPTLTGVSSLESVACVKKACGWFGSLSFLDSFITTKGRVSLIVGGNQVASESWMSTLGQDQAFTLTSSCVQEGPVSVNLYDDANVKIDEEAQVLA